MQHPIPDVFGVKLNVTRLCNSSKHGVLFIPEVLWFPSSFGPCDYELIAMQVNGMVIHPQIDQPDAHSLALFHQHRGCGRSRLAIEGEPVELHRQRVGYGIVGQNSPLLDDDAEVAVDRRRVGLLRVHDEHTEHAHHFLHREVRVVKEGACLV